MDGLPTIVNGPGFISWLESKGVTRIEFPQERAFSSLKHGQNLSVWRADRILTRIGYHINDIPDDLWIDHHNAGKPNGRYREQCLIK